MWCGCRRTTRSSKRRLVVESSPGGESSPLSRLGPRRLRDAKAVKPWRGSSRSNPPRRGADPIRNLGSRRVRTVAMWPSHLDAILDDRAVAADFLGLFPVALSGNAQLRQLFASRQDCPTRICIVEMSQRQIGSGVAAGCRPPLTGRLASGNAASARCSRDCLRIGSLAQVGSGFAGHCNKAQAVERTNRPSRLSQGFQVPARLGDSVSQACLKERENYRRCPASLAGAGHGIGTG